MFSNNRSPLAYVLKVGVVLLGFGLLVFGNFGNRLGFPVYSYESRSNDDDDDDSDGNDTVGLIKLEGKSIFNEPYTADAKIAQLNISGGGTSYNLSDTTSQLFRAETTTHFGKYDFSHHNEGSTYVLNFDMKNKKGGHFNFDTGDDKSNAATFKLNPNPEWDINVETGATALDFDLTKFKIRTLKLSGGAASFNVKLGQPLATTNVEVSTGMASVDINIPQNAACRITTDSGLSSTDFDGFTKMNDGNYQTPGFEAAKNKILINISGGISDFNVKRY